MKVTWEQIKSGCATFKRFLHLTKKVADTVEEVTQEIETVTKKKPKKKTKAKGK